MHFGEKFVALRNRRGNLMAAKYYIVSYYCYHCLVVQVTFNIQALLLPSSSSGFYS